MDNRQLDLGLVSGLRAEVFGEPGQRTFRIYAETTEGRISLWVEKEQVVMLGSALHELLQRVPGSRGSAPESDVIRSFVGELDVKVGALAVGYDADHAGFTLEASDFVSQFDLGSIALLASRSQFEAMEDQIREIVAGGRPRCPLCGTPLSGEAHFCPQSNGHAEIAGIE